MAWCIQSETDKKLYWSNDHGWVPPNQAVVFSNMDKQTVQLPMGGKWAKPPKTVGMTGNTYGFYEAVEKFTGHHPGDDKASKELENLCAKLREKDALYCEMLSAYSNNKRTTFPDMLEFAYRLLQLQN